MPANIAHMLIAHKAIQTLKSKKIAESAAFREFAEMLDDSSEGKNYKAYVNLGSMGPDLYYYAKLSSSAKDMLSEGFVQAKGVTPWSYHLHSQRPNEFPLKLIEIMFSDVVRKKGKAKLDQDDFRKLAYIAGHLTHIAADQIIHPVVNSVAGPYYRSGANRKKHRECEVFQDYYLYEEVYRLEEKTGSKYDFFEQDFRQWADCVRGWTPRNSEDWFRYFLQRGFMESYGLCPEEDQIENSVYNLLLTLRACKTFGPYKNAAKDYKKKGHDSEMFKEYVKDVKYLKYYRIAVELAVIYLIALYEVYFTLKEDIDFTGRHKERFQSIVSDADLSCPLKKNIFEEAKKQLGRKGTMVPTIRTHLSPLLAKTEFAEPTRIFRSRSDKTVVRM